MFQVLAEMICPEKLLALITFCEFMDVCQMRYPCVPVVIVGKSFTAVATDQVRARTRRWRRVGATGSRRDSAGVMKGSTIVTAEVGARPRVAAEMERVLMAFSFVLVFETVVTKATYVLFFHLMITRESERSAGANGGCMCWTSSALK